MKKIINPILRGFNPDPSIVRVGDDYYIATSTFEWFPGVMIHHSRDLVHWHMLARPLDRVSQLDLRGVGASQGVWAPSLTRDGGLFYLAYTVIAAFYCNMYDTHNFLVTAPDILGPWSEPVPLSNFGFDPSLFHDDDGRKYMVSMVTDHRVPKKYAGRLILQEYDPVQKRMTGPVHEIYTADKVFLEGPHILKRNEWYYLFAADTGTGEGHGQTIQRSKSLTGPYEVYRADFMRRDGENEAYSILTSRHAPDHPLQKAGHADLVETQGGEWFAVHLCGRPLERFNPPDAPRFPGARRYMLGRETAIQRVRWTEDGWLRLMNGGQLPDVEVDAPDLPECPWPERPVRDDFDRPALDIAWQFLRVPLSEDHLSLTARPGWLRLYGGDGLSSRFAQSLIAQRVTEYAGGIETALEFAPCVFKQMAGLVLLYDYDNYLYLHVSHDEQLGRVIALLIAENRRYQYPAGFEPIPDGRVFMGLDMVQGSVQFRYRVEGEDKWRSIGPEIDASFLSDEGCREGWFTGAMAGLCCQDLTGAGLPADFDYFDYRAWEDRHD